MKDVQPNVTMILEAAGKYIPQGCEVIAETYIDVIDVGLFFANVSQKKENVNVSLDMSKYRLSPTQFNLRLVASQESQSLGTISASEVKEVELIVPPRSVVMLEAY
jgi:hypothetical protein